MSPRTVRLGAGAGFAGDRIDPAVELAEHADLDYLVFECLGERTVAAGHIRRLSDPSLGYDPMLAVRLRAVLPACHRNGTTLVTNSGAANPTAAGVVAEEVARELGLHGLRIAVVSGDDVLDAVTRLRPTVWETGQRLAADPEGLISANAYIGADAVVDALAQGADVVITGRLADPSLYVGPLRHEFGWAPDDVEALGRGTMVGHLLECAGQLTGGYFADPGTKPVPDLERLGFPFADVDSTGRAILSKLPTSGGLLDERTCAEQLMYEVDDPSGYITPDVVADFTGVAFTQLGPDTVRAEGATGRRRPDEFKVTLGVVGGWLGEGQISYAGPRARERAELAGDVVRHRLERVHGIDPDRVDTELIGAGAAFRGLAPPSDPIEVRLRVTGRTETRAGAEAVGWEVESLYTNGPAGGGGARASVQEVVSVRSCLIPRHLFTSHVEVREVS